MEVLFATTNPAKIKSYKEKLENRGIKVLTLKDIDLNIDIEETGSTAIENACIKAENYGKIAKKVTISIDTNLFFENLPESVQPGTHVRRVDGKTLTDEEMITYYKNLANKYGGKIVAKWVNGIAIYNGKETKDFSTNSDFLNNSTAVYEEFDGNFGDISNCKTFDDLPENAKIYLKRIEEYTGVPVKFIGTGAGRNDMIVR